MTEPAKCPLCDFAPQLVDYLRDRPGVMVVECERCGDFRITRQGRTMLKSEAVAAKRHLLSAITRKASDANEPVELTPGNIERLLSTLHLPPTPLPIIDRLLLDIAHRTESLSVAVGVDGEDYPLYYQRTAQDLNALLGLLHQLGRIQQIGARGEYWLVRVTPAGWQHVEALESARVRSKQAFVAMWFDKEMDVAYFDGIKPALAATGFTDFRVDRAEFTGKIDDRIIAELRRSGLLIADFTRHRQGVYFEAGFAMGLDRPVIWCCRADEIDKAHFDTRQYNHITWETPEELKTRLIDRIRATIRGTVVDNSDANPKS